VTTELKRLNRNVLFTISRSKNLNMVVYEALLDPKTGGKSFVEAGAVDVYWLDLEPSYRKKNRDGGQLHDRADLIWIEKWKAYGATATATAKAGVFDLELVSVPGMGLCALPMAGGAAPISSSLLTDRLVLCCAVLCCGAACCVAGRKMTLQMDAKDDNKPKVYIALKKAANARAKRLLSPLRHCTDRSIRCVCSVCVCFVCVQSAETVTCVLERIFVDATDGWTGPTVNFIDLIGRAPDGSVVSERQKP
jgi:hypothetical protein